MAAYPHNVVDAPAPAAVDDAAGAARRLLGALSVCVYPTAEETRRLARHVGPTLTLSVGCGVGYAEALLVQAGCTVRGVEVELPCTLEAYAEMRVFLEDLIRIKGHEMLPLPAEPHCLLFVFPRRPLPFAKYVAAASASDSQCQCIIIIADEQDEEEDEEEEEEQEGEEEQEKPAPPLCQPPANALLLPPFAGGPWRQTDRFPVRGVSRSIVAAVYERHPASPV